MPESDPSRSETTVLPPEPATTIVPDVLPPEPITSIVPDVLPAEPTTIPMEPDVVSDYYVVDDATTDIIGMDNSEIV